MKKAVLLLLTLAAALTATAQESYIDKVNPFVDTHKSRWFFFDSASLPFGMVSLSPDTATADSWNSGYMYDSLHVRCFSHVHNWQMSGVPVLPTTGEFKGHKGMDTYRSNSPPPPASASTDTPTPRAPRVTSCSTWAPTSPTGPPPTPRPGWSMTTRSPAGRS